MGQSVAILVVLASKAFMMVAASRDGAFLWPLRLVGQHVSFQILERPATV